MSSFLLLYLTFLYVYNIYNNNTRFKLQKNIFQSIKFCFVTYIPTCSSDVIIYGDLNFIYSNSLLYITLTLFSTSSLPHDQLFYFLRLLLS